MPHEWFHPAAPHLLILVQSMYEGQEVLPRDLHLGTFWDAVWAFLGMFCLCRGAGSPMLLYLTTLATDLGEKIVRNGGKLGSKEITLTCICTVFTRVV